MRVARLLLAFLPLSLFLGCCAFAQDADPAVTAADTAYDAKQYEVALPLYRTVVSSDLPDDVRARAQYRVSNCHHALKDRGQAGTDWFLIKKLFTRQVAYAMATLPCVTL